MREFFFSIRLQHNVKKLKGSEYFLNAVYIASVYIRQCRAHYFNAKRKQKYKLLLKLIKSIVFVSLKINPKEKTLW